MLGSVDPWVDLLIHWSTDPLMYRSTDLRRASSSLPLPSFSHDLKFFFPSALLFGSSITVGLLFRCPTIHSGFATVFAERLETSIYQCGRICGRWVDDVSLSISSSFKETLNRFCASWGKQPLPFIPVALRQIWLLANQVEYGRTFRAEKRSAQASAHPLSQAQGGLFCVLTVFDSLFVCHWESSD